MAFGVGKISYFNGPDKEPPCVEFQTTAGKMKVEAGIFKGLIESSEGVLGVELTNGIKISNLKEATPEGIVEIYKMPISSNVPRKNKDISIFVEKSTVQIDSANDEMNCVDIYNKDGDVSIEKDAQDAVYYRTDDDSFYL